eukprot:GHVN01037253.1.p1 GENE.GHVN01037253.1~~GHVN01037253.1.p1  ORF type:complete len:156 (-),score=14.87 GHVN01037253.1:364-831(-)
MMMKPQLRHSVMLGEVNERTLAEHQNIQGTNHHGLSHPVIPPSHDITEALRNWKQFLDVLHMDGKIKEFAMLLSSGLRKLLENGADATRRDDTSFMRVLLTCKFTSDVITGTCIYNYFITLRHSQHTQDSLVNIERSIPTHNQPDALSTLASLIS